jgi:integration host factor subunit alpha
MSLNKQRLIDSISDQCGYSKRESGELVESILEILKQTLESGEDVLISGFGKLCVKDKSERRGRNPQTGDELTLSALSHIVVRNRSFSTTFFSLYL